MNNSTAIKILKFWFGEDYKNWPEKEISRNWFMGGKPFDDAINEQFSELMESILSEDLQIPTNSEELLATVILLDQFTRNVYRGSAAAFRGDEKALKLSLHAVEHKMNLQLPAHQRIFLYMPFEHSEEFDHQQACVKLFEEMVEEFAEPVSSKVAGFYSYAKEHYEIVKQFRRFPHRNKVLGREPTAEETDYLVKGKSFGQ